MGRTKTGGRPFTRRTHEDNGTLDSETQCLRQKNSPEIANCQSGEELSPLIADEWAEAATPRHADCSYRRQRVQNAYINIFLTHQSPVNK